MSKLNVTKVHAVNDIQPYRFDFRDGVREAWGKWKEFEADPGYKKMLFNDREMLFAQQCYNEWRNIKNKESLSFVNIFSRKAQQYGYNENWIVFFEILCEELDTDE